MNIPDDFRPMTDDEIVSKYYTTTKPFVLLTNPDMTVDLGINKSTTQWNPDDIEMMVKFQKANIFSLYDKIDILSEGTKMIEDRKYVYLEFESTINAETESIRPKPAIRKYTYMQYVIIKGQTYVFNFTTPIELKSKWQSSVTEIMKSAVFKGKRK